MQIKKTKAVLISLTVLATFTLAWAGADSIVNNHATYRVLNSQENTPLSQNTGKPLLVVFWAGWCAPCLMEIPAINDLHKKHKNDIKILAFNMDLTTDDNVHRIVQRNKIRYTVAQPSNDLIREYEVSAIPASYLYNKDGKLVKNWIGPPNPGELEREVSKLLSGVSPVSGEEIKY